MLKGTHNGTRGRQQRGHLPKAEIEKHRKAAEKRNKAYFLKQKAEKKRKKEIEMRKKKAISDAIRRVDHLPGTTPNRNSRSIVSKKANNQQGSENKQQGSQYRK